MAIFLTIQLLLLIIFLISFRKKKHKYFIVPALCLVTSYISILIFVQMINVQLEQKLMTFDLNKDGVFSIAEQTPAQIDAMNAWAGR